MNGWMKEWKQKLWNGAKQCSFCLPLTKKKHVFDTFSNIDIITHKWNLPSDIVSKNLGKAIMKKNHFIRMTPFSVITSTIMSFKIFYKNPWVCIFCLRKVWTSFFVVISKIYWDSDTVDSSLLLWSGGKLLD